MLTGSPDQHGLGGRDICCLHFSLNVHPGSPTLLVVSLWAHRTTWRPGVQAGDGWNSDAEFTWPLGTGSTRPAGSAQPHPDGKVKGHRPRQGLEGD